MADDFKRGFASTFGQGLQIGASAAQTQLQERIKKQQEKAEKETAKAEAQTGYESIITAISKSNPELGEKLGDLDVSKIPTETLNKMSSLVVTQSIKGDDKFKDIQELISLQADAKKAGSPEAGKVFQAVGKSLAGMIGESTPEEQSLPSRISATSVPTDQPKNDIEKSITQSVSKPEKFSIDDLEAPEIDPFTGKLTTQGEQQKAKNDLVMDSLKTSERKLADINLKRKQLSKELGNFFVIDDEIERGVGFIGRMKAGLSTKFASLDQSTLKGFSAAAHEGAVKRLRVMLVRAAGDVGNISRVEQEAAEQIVPSFFDAEGTAKIKRAFLKEASSIVQRDDQDMETDLKKLINKFSKTDAFTGPKGEDFDKLSGKMKGKLDTGVDFEVIQ